MMKTTRKVLTIILSIVLVVSLAGVAWSLIGYQVGEQDYSVAEELAMVSNDSENTETPNPVSADNEIEIEDTEAEIEETPDVEASAEQPAGKTELPVLKEINLKALQEVNGDVLGWLQIPGTEISYPFLQGTDNDFYLNHTWQKKRSAVGAIFLDYRNSKDLSNFNTIIYGHNMKDDSMFGGLHDFRSKSFLENHPYVNVIDGTGLHAYRIFAVYEVSVSTAEAYQLAFAGDEEKQAFLDCCLSLSSVDAGVVPGVEDKVITLSTCTGRGHATRWVVQAVLEAETANEAEM